VRKDVHFRTGPRQGVAGVQCLGRHFWWKEGIPNGLSRMNLKLDLGFWFWLRLDLPYVPVWPGLSRFKRLSRCHIPVSKMSRNFTSGKFSKLTPAWWCIVMKCFRPERLDFALTHGLGRGGTFRLWGAALFDSAWGGTSPCRGPVSEYDIRRVNLNFYKVLSFLGV